MAFPSLPSICLLALAAALCVFQAEGRLNTVQDCCSRFSDKSLPVNAAHRIQSYENQGPHMGCTLQAIALLTKNGRWLCFRSDDANALQIVKILNARRSRKQQNSRRV
ncbi:C-C motif chemokine 21b-like [Podarcis muralis]